MNLIEKATIKSFHDNRTEIFGASTVEALGWKNKESQLKRFEVLASVANLNKSVILDAGCGYGDLKAYLDNQFIELDYIGVDQMPEFIDKAKKIYHGIPNTHFIAGDFSKFNFKNIDYVLASGALSYRCERYEYYRETIIHMFNIAKKGIAFNMLDALSFPKHSLLKGHDKTEVLKFCKKLSSQAKIIEDYLENDFTVVLLK